MSNDNNYVRKKFEVVAQRVTPLNIEELARWSGGVIHHDGKKEGNFSRDYIKVEVQNASNPDHERAKVGDWIVKSGKIWKVYGDKAFRKTFEREDGQPVGFTDISGGVAEPERPVFKQRGNTPVPTPPRRPAPQVTNNADGTVTINGVKFTPEGNVPLSDPNPVDMGANVEVPNDDGSITVVPTPDSDTIAQQNALQVDPAVEAPVVNEKDVTVDQELVREGKTEAIVAGEVARTGVVPDETQVQPPVMTEVAPGVEVSDGPIQFATTSEVVDAPTDVVVPEPEIVGQDVNGTPIYRTQ